MFKRKRVQIFIMAALVFTGTLLSGKMTAWASTDSAVPTMARTRAWDTIVETLGGVPESVGKIEYAGSEFYLGEGVTAEDCLTILEGKPEVPLLKATRDSGVLYGTPVYIFWNADKTVLMIHALNFDHQDILNTEIIPIEPPKVLIEREVAKQIPTRSTEFIIPDDIYLTPIDGMTAMETVEYMLSDEYTAAVRNEFYRILNEHRVNNGLHELEINLDLQDYADIRAIEQRTLFGHTRPCGGAAGSGWYNSYNVMGSRYAENCIGAATLNRDPIIAAKSIFSRWKNSPGHNKHMLYDFNENITMAFGLVPEFDEHGVVSSGGIFATGY